MTCEICGKKEKLFKYNGYKVCESCLKIMPPKRKPVFCAFCGVEIKSIYLKNGTQEKVVCYPCFELMMEGGKK